MGVPRSRGALGGLQKLKDIRHDGYQSYSDFSPENKSKVATKTIWNAGPERVMLKTQIDNADSERLMHKT